MNNKQLADRLEQAHSAEIANLFWIGGQINNQELERLLSDLSYEDWIRMFPRVPTYENLEPYSQALYESGYFGFVAEVNIPTPYGFTFDNEKPIAWSINFGYCSIQYVYSETISGLVREIEKRAEKYFRQVVSEQKEKLKLNHPNERE